MSNVIRFLEQLGNRPAMSHAEYMAAVDLLDADDAQKRALLEVDHDRLTDLLGGRERMICMVASPDQEDMPAKSPDEQEETPTDPEPER